MSAAQALGGAAALVALAGLAGFAPQRLLSLLRGGSAWKLPGLRLSLAAAVAGLAVHAVGMALVSWETALALGALATLLAAMAVVDAAHFVIPDLHVVLIAVLGLVGPLAPHWTMAAAGALLGGLLLGGVRALYGRVRGLEGLGLGDVKLAAALGAIAGPRDILWIVLAAALLGLVYGLIRGLQRTAAMPFGTALALPALVTVAMSRWSS